MAADSGCVDRVTRVWGGEVRGRRGRSAEMCQQLTLCGAMRMTCQRCCARAQQPLTQQCCAVLSVLCNCVLLLLAALQHRGLPALSLDSLAQAGGGAAQQSINHRSAFAPALAQAPQRPASPPVACVTGLSNRGHLETLQPLPNDEEWLRSFSTWQVRNARPGDERAGFCDVVQLTNDAACRTRGGGASWACCRACSRRTQGRRRSPRSTAVRPSLRPLRTLRPCTWSSCSTGRSTCASWACRTWWCALTTHQLTLHARTACRWFRWLTRRPPRTSATTTPPSAPWSRAR